MTLSGYRARWRGREYEASPAPSSSGLSVRLYTEDAADGFSLVRNGRYRREVPASEVERLVYVRPVAVWRGEPFLVRAREGGWASLEYTGGNAAVAARLGCERAGRGVYRIRVRADSLSDVRDDVVVLSVGEPDPGSAARPG